MVSVFGSELIALIEEHGIDKQYVIALDGTWAGDLAIGETWPDGTVVIISEAERFE